MKFTDRTSAEGIAAEVRCDGYKDDRCLCTCTLRHDWAAVPKQEFYTVLRGPERMPVAAKFLGAVLVEAARMEKARGDFFAWCDDTGFSPADEEAHVMFRLVRNQTGTLKRFLADKYEVYVRLSEDI
ncbi:hypothetical protein NGB36_03070 [Streptomyces sp. RB6PN25]|uniref:Uncharacterized protein n=1 Tax=Streptomyces humicola TaxID=2953240 RepID=A0ABT1PPK0_9ACTN|nr:hypothetical protein [Streptomyces humicola]MCQ4079605.1 hypothetical protein [Streptomyces humicola]